MPPETPNTFKLTAEDLILIREALRIAEDQLRYADNGGNGPCYQRSISMSRLAERVTVALGILDATIVPMRVQS